MKTRIISGILVVAIMLALVWAGGPVLAIGLAVIAGIGFLEMTHALGVREQSGQVHILEIIGIIATAVYYILIYVNASFEYLMLYSFLMLPLFMAITVFTYPKNNTAQALSVFCAFIYVSVMLSFIFLTRQIGIGVWDGFTKENVYNKGFFSVWMTFVSAWGSDTCAYFVGVAIGKHKAFPKLSPKKSVEGCIGGVVGAGLCGLLYSTVLNLCGYSFPEMFWVFPLIGVAGSIIGQVGDLAASAIKRDHKIKDYGKVIPGHGGILDRFDSVIFTAPMIFLLSIIFIK